MQNCNQQEPRFDLREQTHLLDDQKIDEIMSQQKSEPEPIAQDTTGETSQTKTGAQEEDSKQDDHKTENPNAQPQPADKTPAAPYQTSSSYNSPSNIHLEN